MAPLSPGAVELPPHHLSVRVPWHDTDWTGRVCREPGANHSCSVLKNIKERKIDVVEAEVAGRPWGELDAKEVPPCVVERAGFMRAAAFSTERVHPYKERRFPSHAHFAPTIQRMPKYSIEAIPFRWVRRDSYELYSQPWGIEVDGALEERADRIMDYETGWIQDERNQRAMLDSFFSALRPRRSLVLLYVKDLPLIEEPRAGERFLIGAGFVTGVDPVVSWEYSEKGELQSIMWERGVAHSIRPDFSDGFLLPYHRLLEDPAFQGVDLSEYVARTPADHFDEFSYVSELVSEDATIAALEELGRVLELITDTVDGPWEQARAWVGDRVAEAWQARGPYPGMGPMLAAAGIERGALLARRVLDELPDDADPWPPIEAAIAANRDGLVGRLGRKAWEKVTGDAQRYRQLRVMSRFALNRGQARALFDTLKPGEVIENPYLLSRKGAGPRSHRRSRRSIGACSPRTPAPALH